MSAERVAAEKSLEAALRIIALGYFEDDLVHVRPEVAQITNRHSAQIARAALMRYYA